PFFLKAPRIPLCRKKGSCPLLLSLLAVVGLWPVAAGSTASTRVRLDELQRQAPRPEWHRVGDECRAAAAVHLVAQTAASSLLRVVDVQIVEVALTVPEVRRERRLGILEQLPLVAGEAERVVLVGIGDVRILGKRRDQELRVRPTVRIVTA